MLTSDTVGLVAGGMLGGSWLARLAGAVTGEARAGEGRRDSAGRAPARGSRALARAEPPLAALLVLAAVVSALTGAPPMASVSSASAILAGAHVVVVGAWLGALARFAVCLGGAPDTQASSPLVRPGVSRVAVLLLAIVGATALAAARAVDGWPALVGTRYGRWLLLQSALLAVTVAVVAVAHLGAWRAGVDAARSPDGDPSTPRAGTRRCLGRVLAIEIAVGAAMVVAAAMLAGLAGAAEPTRWPFGFRPAPGVMLRSPGAVDRVISATAIALIGVLALVGAWRFKGGRPLLLAGGAMFLAIGLYQALAAMSIDAYPTTYARPAVAADAESIRRGHALFATRCAACHGRTGRGDGPAGAGLLQRPADLTASHTSDHTPGDLFWWITHGLGLSMPAFGDQLSVAERWDLVNFVRTLAAGRESPVSVR